MVGLVAFAVVVLLCCAIVAAIKEFLGWLFRTPEQRAAHHQAVKRWNAGVASGAINSDCPKCAYRSPYPSTALRRCLTCRTTSCSRTSLRLTAD